MPNDAIDIARLATQVLWAGFALGVLFGAIAQRTHFCTMGAIADVVNMGDWSRARMWVLAIGTAMIGFAAMTALGWVDPTKTIYTAPRFVWLSNAIGGLMFGFGMVLASGCGSKTLVRVGAGNLKSLVVFIVLGLSAFATLKGITGVLRVNTIDTVATTLATAQTLPAIAAPMLGWTRGSAALALGVALGGVLVLASIARREGRSGDLLLGGVGIGALVAAGWWVTGHLGFVAEDPKTLEEAFVATNSGRMESLTFVAPIAYTLDWLMFFSDKSKLLTFGIVTTVGVVVGSGAVALLDGSFRFEGFGSVEDTANHLVGALLMGVGGVTAMGCTIGQGISGVSTLALGSFVALAGIVAGAVLALRWQVWRIERMA
jgi:uncharacterized protein